jgi:hypothetical protein
MAKVKAKQDSTSFEVITQEDKETGDILVPIPQELLDRLDWKVGDELDFAIDKTGRIIIKQSK